MSCYVIQKNKINSGNDFPLGKTLNVHNVVRIKSTFKKNHNH